MTEIATETKPKFTLMATKNELNSYLFAHTFNWEPIASDDDLEALMGYAELSFGQDKPYGLDYLHVVIVDNETNQAPFFRMRVPLADKQFAYFHVLPAHDELEQYIKPIFCPPNYEFNGKMMRSARMDPSTFLKEGQEPLPHHPRHPELLTTFNPLTPTQIEAIAKREEEWLASQNTEQPTKKKRGRPKKSEAAAAE